MLTQYASWTPALPGHQVVLGAADVALRQATHRHRSAEVHVHSAKVLTEDPPGLQQSLRERERENQNPENKQENEEYIYDAPTTMLHCGEYIYIYIYIKRERERQTILRAGELLTDVDSLGLGTPSSSRAYRDSSRIRS